MTIQSRSARVTCECEGTTQKRRLYYCYVLPTPVVPEWLWRTSRAVINISISSGSLGGNKFTCHVFVTPIFVKNVLPLSSPFNWQPSYTSLSRQPSHDLCSAQKTRPPNVRMVRKSAYSSNTATLLLARVRGIPHAAKTNPTTEINLCVIISLF
jgi:hypothetical protein